MSIRIAFPAALLVVLSSCVFLKVGDNSVRVRGELVKDVPGDENCLLELRSASNGYPLKHLQIAGVFDTSFTISPWPQSYYVVIICPRVGEVARSPTFRVKDALTPPVDLGQIRVKVIRSIDSEESREPAGRAPGPRPRTTVLGG